MPSAFRTQKNLAEWIELDGHRRSRGLRRWRNLLAWGTLAVCLAGLSAALVLPKGPRMIQAGPLTSAHGMFNDNCSTCHVDSFQSVKKLVSPGGAHSVSDSACEKCHEGPPHNENVSAKVSCATCHREHRGKMSLRDVADGHCIACHGNLAGNMRAGAGDPRFRNVHSFNQDHPPIRQRGDPGELHFNHKAHLKKGGIPGRDGKTTHLNCADCHKVDSAGQYIEPIRYADHCAKCHPLTVRLTGDLVSDERDREKLQRAVRDFNGNPAPHDRPEIVRAVLRERLLEFVQDFPMVAGDTSGRLFDSKLLGRRGTRPPSESEWRWTRERLGTVERLLFPERQKEVNEQVLFENAGGCRFCHIQESRQPGGADLGGLPFYKKTEIKPRWLQHARFNHEKHRVLRCTECHQAEESEKTADVLMPDLASCQKCHNPTVGARHDCVECHSYHDPLLGGGRRRGLTIEGCLGK